MNKKLLAALLPVALAAAYGHPALAQDSTAPSAPSDAPTAVPTAVPTAEPSPPTAPAQDAPATTTVVVTGFRSSLQKALNLKQ